MPGDYTVNQLTYLYNTFCQALDSGKEVRAVFCDISKAFDRGLHSGLLHKLRAAGVTENILNWFKSYLADRKQRIVLPNAVSEWKFITAGVPQGSILGIHSCYYILMTLSSTLAQTFDYSQTTLALSSS